MKKIVYKAASFKPIHLVYSCAVVVVAAGPLTVNIADNDWPSIVVAKFDRKNFRNLE